MTSIWGTEGEGCQSSNVSYTLERNAAAPVESTIAVFLKVLVVLLRKHF